MLAPLAVPDLPTGHRCRQETPRHIMCIRLGLHAGWPGVSASFLSKSAHLVTATRAEPVFPEISTIRFAGYRTSNIE